MKFTKQKIKTMIGVYTCAFCLMGMLAPAPIIALIAESFPTVDIVWIQMVISLPPLIAAFAGMGVSSILAHRFYKKHVALVSLAIMFLAGMGIRFFFHSSIVEILLCTALFGLGFGGAQNASDSLLADYFVESERNVTFGLYGVCVGLGGVVWPMIAGACAGSGVWVDAYNSFFLMVPMFIIALVCMPKGKIEPKREKNLIQSISKLVVGIVFFSFFYNLVCQLYSTNVSLIVMGRDFGGVAAASLATMAFTCAGLIGGVLVRPLFVAFKNRALPVCVLATLIGLFVCLVSSNLVMLAIGGFLASLGQQAYVPLAGNYTAANSQQAGRAFNLAFAQAGNSFGQAFSPMIFGLLAAPLGGTVEAKFEIGVAMLVVLVVIGFIAYRKLTPGQIDEAKRMEAYNRGEIEDASTDVIIEK